jgi:hypothetical protein
VGRCKRPEGLLIILRNLGRSMIARQAYRAMLITPSRSAAITAI